MSSVNLQRTAFTISRALEFFSEKELSMQIGHGEELWPIAVLKELIDNALDACESERIAPKIVVKIEPDEVTVADNGPGIPAPVIERSLDYAVRVSDKLGYVSPSRGQIGNALKCIWAAPFVAWGDTTTAIVETQGRKHAIKVSLDQIGQQPRIAHTIESAPDVKTGTKVHIGWPGVASYLDEDGPDEFYEGPDVGNLLGAYSALNPHAEFTLIRDGTSFEFPAQAVSWEKWSPSDPTSPYWYDLERFKGLIAVYLSEERENGNRKTVRSFVSEFAGLSGSRKQAAVIKASSLAVTHLDELIDEHAIDEDAAEKLLEAMQGGSRPIKPKRLGPVGRDAFVHSALRICIEVSIRYRKIEGVCDGVPYIVEGVFGHLRDREANALIQTGLNWSSTLNPESHVLLGLRLNRVYDNDPVHALVHIIYPRFTFTDRGKTRLDLPPGIKNDIDAVVKSITADWRKIKKLADRKGRARQRDIEEAERARRCISYSIKQAACEVMSDAYAEASDNGTLPANARQIMYQARPKVLKLTDGRIWKHSSYFTQTLLPDYMEENPEATRDWDVVFDDRGHLIEPHTEKTIGMGTIAVRRYVSSWLNSVKPSVRPRVPRENFTHGPVNRYGAVLFIEKEGFEGLLSRARIRERFDIAVMSSKGMTVTAVRELAERFAELGIRIFVLHDFDKAGFAIVKTLTSSNRRYTYRTMPEVVDLGLRLDDVRRMDLQDEVVTYDSNKDPRINLRENGATEDECNFLVRKGPPWEGERAELNAMTSRQFIDFIEA